MMRRVRGLVATLAVAVLVTACGEQVGTADGGPDLTGGWHLVEGGDTEGTLDLEGRTVTLRVEGDQAGGTSACNHYSGRVEVEADRVRFSELGGTEMGCEPDVMALESRYLRALGAVESGERAGDRLTLTGPAIVLAFEADPPVEDAPFVGTAWHLESVLEGETVASVLGEGGLSFAEDGTFGGSTGCRPVRGDYRLDGDTLTVTALESGAPEAGACAPGLEAQHDHVVTVLEARPTATVEGARLTLLAPEGTGLDFRAG